MAPRRPRRGISHVSGRTYIVTVKYGLDNEPVAIYPADACCDFTRDRWEALRPRVVRWPTIDQYWHFGADGKRRTATWQWRLCDLQENTLP